MNFYKRHLGDYAKDAGHLTMLEHGAYTLLLDRYYTTEKPIPSSAEAYRVCRARSGVEKAAVDAVLAEFFITDGEAFTNRRAEEEIAKASHQRSVNQELGKRGGRPKKTDSDMKGKTDSVANSNPSQTPDSTSQTPEETGTEVFPLPGAGQADDVPGDWQPTPAGLVCRALREAGIGMVSPSHPRLVALLEAGATAEEFVVFAGKAKDMSDPFAYVLGCVEGERKRAKRNGAEMHRGRLPSKQEAIEQRNRAAADEWLAQQGST